MRTTANLKQHGVTKCGSACPDSIMLCQLSTAEILKTIWRIPVSGSSSLRAGGNLHERV